MRETVGPFMKVFGSKWSATKRGDYPEPKHETIFEMFAGGAGYSCSHYDKRVYLNEANDELRYLWEWLVNGAEEELIREIPIFEPGVNLKETELSLGQMLLVKWWQRTNNHGTKTFVTSPWSNKPGQWTSNTRARIAEQIDAIRHWRVGWPPNHWTATVFVDPPYQHNYRYGAKLSDYFFENLGDICLGKSRAGHQVIVCEALGKNGERPEWLPFRESHRQVNSRRRHSRELIWTG